MMLDTDRTSSSSSSSSPSFANKKIVIIMRTCGKILCFILL